MSPKATSAAVQPADGAPAGVTAAAAGAMPAAMAKAALKREAIIERLADFLLAEGLGAASLRPMAAAVGTSDRMLLYYFKDRQEIVAAALGCAAARLAGQLAAGDDGRRRTAAQLEADMLTLTSSPAVWPFMCLSFEVAALAARGDAMYRAIGSALATGFRDWVAERLEIDDPAAREAEAWRILRIVDGALFLRALGVEASAPP